MHDIFLLLSTEIRIKKHVLGIGLASFNFFHMQAEYLPLTFSVFEFNCFRRFLTFWNSGLFLLLSRQYQYAGFFTWIKLLILLFTHGGSLYRHKYPFYGEWNKMKSFRQFFFFKWIISFTYPSANEFSQGKYLVAFLLFSVLQISRDVWGWT